MLYCGYLEIEKKKESLRDLFLSHFGTRRYE